MSDGISTVSTDGFTVKSTAPQEALSKAFEKTPETPKDAPETPVDAPDDSPPEPEAAKAPEAVQKPNPRKDPKARIDQLTREKGELERRLAEIEARTYDAPAKPAPKPEPQQPKGKPTLDQFETVEQYTEAVADWKLEQWQQTQTQNARKQAEDKAVHETLQTYSKRMQEHIAKNPDFWEKVPEEMVNWRPLSEMSRMGVDIGSLTPYARLQGAITDFFLVSETPGPLIEYFAGNPMEVERLMGVHPRRLYAELGKIEDRLGAASTGSAPKPQISRAKPPVSPVTAVAPSVSDSDDLPDPKLSDIEWGRKREALEAKRLKAQRSA